MSLKYEPASEPLPTRCVRRTRRAEDFTLWSSIYTPHPTPYTLHPTPFILHPTPYTLHPSPYTLHPTPHTLHPTPFTLHPSPYAPHPTPLIQHSAGVKGVGEHSLESRQLNELRQRRGFSRWGFSKPVGRPVGRSVGRGGCEGDLASLGRHGQVSSWYMVTMPLSGEHGTYKTVKARLWPI